MIIKKFIYLIYKIIIYLINFFRIIDSNNYI